MTAVLGIGTDIVEISRIGSVLDRQGGRFARRILADAEYTRCDIADPRAMAKAFAAKEAVAKALGTGFREGVGWQDIVVARDTLGAPTVSLHGGAASRVAALGGHQVWLTLSDEREYVVAFAILT